MIAPNFAFELVRWLSDDHGIRHVRLTGGEPLLYPELTPLVHRLATLDQLDEITLTTNGQALERKAAQLRDAGLTRVNISLDTLDPDRFAHVTRGGCVAHTLKGIQAAIESGLTPVKLNMVVQRGLNDDEIVDTARWGLELGCSVRFLEVMPIGPLAQVARFGRNRSDFRGDFGGGTGLALAPGVVRGADPVVVRTYLLA